MKFAKIFSSCVLRLLLVIGAMLPLGVRAELPSVKLFTAPLITPTNAWSYFGPAAGHTTGVIGWTSSNRPSEIKELARALSRGGALTGGAYADQVLEYVRNNIQVDFRFGLAKGARGALIDQSGTPFDQANLMVELLREGGVAATYQVGTVTLNGAQFYDWTGLSNAQASCQFLADGGIPAIVNGAESCVGLVGNVGSITLAHIWVAAAATLYDPSYKRHVFKVGIDLAAALGCGNTAAPTCASTIKNLIPSPTTVSGVQRITNVPEAAINAQLKVYGVNLLNWIKGYNAANNTSLALEDIIGGRVIDSKNGISSNPISPVVQYSWTGDIPDQFRSTLRVQFDNIDQTLFVDELAGKRLRIWGQGSTEANGVYSRTVALYAEYKPLAKSARGDATPTNANITLTANHPYAANGGSYMDEVLSRNTTFGIAAYTNSGAPGCCWTNVLTILNGWGESSESTVSHFGALQSRDLDSMAAEDITSGNHYWLFKSYLDSVPCVAATPPSTPKPDMGCYEQHQATSAATWLAEISKMTDITAQISGARAQLHHSLGWILSGEKHPVTLLNAETSLSISSATSMASQRQSAFLGIAAGMSRLEGSVFEQQFDSWDGGSGVSYLVKSNAKGYPSFWVNSANVAAAKTQLNNYSQTRKDGIQSYVDAGFDLIVPQNGYLGSYSYTSGNSLTINTNATAAYKATGDRIAYLVDGRYKGASTGSAINPAEAALNSVKIMETSSKKKKFFGFDLARGAFSLSPPPDIVSGTGEFPFSLDYRRFYDSGSAAGAIDGSNGSRGGARDAVAWRPSDQSISDLGGGWSHNYDLSAKMGSDGFKGLGKDDPQDAAAAISAVFTISGLNAGVPSFASHLATIFTTNWWIARLQNNIVTVRRAPKSSIFTRLVDDTSFSPPPGSAERLSQSGDRAFKAWTLNFGSAYIYNGTSFLLTDGMGTTTSFSYLSTSNYNANLAVPAIITDSTGVRVNFAIKGVGQVPGYCIDVWYQCLSGVSNSLGRTLSVDPSLVTDGDGRQISIRSEQSISNNYIGINSPDVSKNNSMFWVPTKIIVTGIDNGVTIYKYIDNPMVPVERSYPRISEWLTPASSTVPYLSADYDSLYRVKGVTDNLSHRTEYYVSGLYGTENRTRAESRDPLLGVSTSYFDGDGKISSQADQLNRTSVKVYDNADRLVREVMPEGNAVEKLYDVRSNVIRECRIAKGRVNWSNLDVVSEKAPQCNVAAGDLVTTTVYVEGPAIWSCADPKTCNKPSYVIDPRGNRTDYTWSSVHGQILTETKPADQNGSRPVTTYGYTAFTGADGAVFYLITSVQMKVDASNTSLTTYSYDASNHWALKSMTQTGGGTTLITCFKFDAVGNLISKTDPRAGLGTCS